jgi:drug/metabolite transporter (DMT)-like permease
MTSFEHQKVGSSFLIGLFFAVVALAAAPILIRLAGEAEAAPLSFWRLLVGTLVWALLSQFQKSRESKKQTLSKQPSPLQNATFERKTRLLSWLAGGLLALHYLTWALAVSMTTVSQAAFLLLVQPLMTGVAAHYLLQERLHIYNMLALAMTLAGAWLLCRGDFAAGSIHATGDILAAVAAFFNMAYLLTGRFVRRATGGHAGLPLHRYLPVLYGSAAIFSLAFALLQGQPLFGYRPATWLALLGLGLIPTVIGHSLLNWAMKRLPALTVNMVISISPLIATAMAWAWLSEPPSSSLMYAAPLLMGAAWLGAWKPPNTTDVRL